MAVSRQDVDVFDQHSRPFGHSTIAATMARPIVDLFHWLYNLNQNNSWGGSAW
jgi:hypothetical protein